MMIINRKSYAKFSPTNPTSRKKKEKNSLLVTIVEIRVTVVPTRVRTGPRAFGPMITITITTTTVIEMVFSTMMVIRSLGKLNPTSLCTKITVLLLEHLNITILLL